jgi:hypothetical protein
LLLYVFVTHGHVHAECQNTPGCIMVMLVEWGWCVYKRRLHITYIIYETKTTNGIMYTEPRPARLFYNYNRRRESLSSEKENFYLYLFHVYENHFSRKCLCIFFVILNDRKSMSCTKHILNSKSSVHLYAPKK